MAVGYRSVLRLAEREDAVRVANEQFRSWLAEVFCVLISDRSPQRALIQKPRVLPSLVFGERRIKHRRRHVLRGLDAKLLQHLRLTDRVSISLA